LLKYFELIFFQLQLAKFFLRELINYELRKKEQGVLFYETACTSISIHSYVATSAKVLAKWPSR